ncbi:capsular biosynthesis protein, partial [Citrobacter freundii]|nr:capsular biosynthesis protein [Citrobacter freundii]
MSLLKSASTIAGSSVISQLIGALSIWLISHKYDMAEVGLYALNYSIAVVGAQVCTFASQLLIPK